MKLLLDFSQIVISAAVDYHVQTKSQVSLDLLRHISLNNILSYKKKFRLDLSDLIICCDGRDYWRKVIFPLYKQNRKKDHDKSKFDWKIFFENFNQIKSELVVDLPFKVVEVRGCEADDVIAVLCQYFCPHESKVIVVSSDKDLLQIQDNLCRKVQQWSPFHKKFITTTSNKYSLFEHIVRGDSGDGIPNIASDDDVFMVDGKRSKPIKATSIMQWEAQGGIAFPEKFCLSENMLDRFKRNAQLIDLREIPKDLVKGIVDQYSSYQPSNKGVFDYLVKHRLKKILELGVL